VSLLKVFSEEKSFKDFKVTGNLVPYTIYDKNEERNITKRYKRYRITFRTSTGSWYEIDTQIQESIDFLRRNKLSLAGLFKKYNVIRAYLDFPVFLSIDDEIINQNEYFPISLLKVTSDLGVGIQLGIYDKKYLDETNKDDIEKLLLMHDRGEY